MEELTQALNIAGPNNTDFLLKAAEEFKAREAWGAAAGIYLRLAPHYQNTGMPEEIENNFHEAVYKSAEQKELQLLDVFERVDAINPQLGHIARGRYALYNGSLDDAKTQLANAEKLEPAMYEVLLLKAEITQKEGNSAETKDILLNLSSDPDVPEWIRFMAENYLKTIQ